MTQSLRLIALVLLTAGLVTACGGAGTSSDREDSAPPSPQDVATVSGARLADFRPDPARGEKIFVRCQTCHAVEPGVKRSGPSLHGIVGQAAGKVPGYGYSPANASAGITWTPDKLFQFLENPQRVMPGNRMAFSGLRDPQDRADLISWLSQQR